MANINETAKSVAETISASMGTGNNTAKNAVDRRSAAMGGINQVASCAKKPRMLHNKQQALVMTQWANQLPFSWALSCHPDVWFQQALVCMSNYYFPGR